MTSTEQLDALAAALANAQETASIVLCGDPVAAEILLDEAFARLTRDGAKFRRSKLERQEVGDEDNGWSVPALSSGADPAWIVEIDDLPSVPAPLLADLLDRASHPGGLLVLSCRSVEAADRILPRPLEPTLKIELPPLASAELRKRAGETAWTLLRGRQNQDLPSAAAAALPAFLALAGVSPQLFVSDLIFDILGVSDEHRQLLVDRLDQDLVEGGSLFDLEYSHPSLHHFSVYRFTGPFPAAVARAALESYQLESLANAAFELWYGLLAKKGRSGHRLLLELASWLGRPERLRLRRIVAWWLPPGEAADLQELLSEGLASGHLDLAELRETIDDTAEIWPGAGRLALLEAYLAAPGNESLPELHAARAAALLDLGAWTAAREAALALLAGSPGRPEDSYLSGCCHAVAGRAAFAQGDLAEAAERLTASLSAATGATAADHRQDPVLRHEVAATIRILSTGGPALLQAALDSLVLTCRHCIGGSGRAAADLWIRLADLLREAGHLELVRASLRRGVAIGRAHSVAPDAQLSTTLKHLGEVELALGGEEAAIPAFEEALAAETELFGHRSAAVETLQNRLIDLYTSRGDRLSARRLLTEALELRRRKYGGASPELVVIAKLLADACRELGDLSGAADATAAALAAEEDLHGADNPALIVPLKRLFDLQRELGEPEAAFATRRRLLALEEKSFGPDDHRLLPSLLVLAALHNRRGEMEAAHVLALRARSIEQRSH